MKRTFILPFLLFYSNFFFAQVYEDYLGAGNVIGMTASSSPETAGDSSAYSISGTQLKPDLIGASRFLSQASLGASYEQIENLSTIGIDAWLDEQFDLPVKSFAQEYDIVYNEIQQLISEDNHINRYTSFVFYDFLVKEPDLLRQKVAFALSQIFVISPYHESSISGDNPYNMTYYDFLYQGAFGNYKDLLTNISLSYPMGNYLSHFMNQKADVIEKTYPDENFAREIMQLFSIGLNMLNQDGTLQLDQDGNSIPTYDIDNITEMAKIFTGLAAGEKDDGVTNDNFFRDWDINGRAPMIMFEDFHSKGEKNILPGIIIPSGQSGMDDIEQTIDVLFNHQNVAPFISKRLIQHLIKSNPTTAYVNRISTVFNNNGQGVRGDFKAVIKAILLDPEARNCDLIDDANTGKLIQPIERFTTLFKAFDLKSPSDRYWFNDFDYLFDETGQTFFSSPSVFNFFSPFYAEDEHIAPKNLVSPEFQILNSVTAIAYINEMEDALKREPFHNITVPNDAGTWLTYDGTDDPFLDLSDELNIYNNQGVDALIDRLNLILCRGQLSETTHGIIANSILQNVQNDSNYTSLEAIHDALYFIMMSPNYLVQK